jgi:phage portal protein BeeE
MGLHLVLTNNFYAYISRVGGRIHELIPLEPSRGPVTRRNDLSLVYTVTGEDGGPAKTFPASDIWHVRGPSWNGWMGMEAVRLAREAIGLSMALEEAHAACTRTACSPAAPIPSKAS